MLFKPETYIILGHLHYGYIYPRYTHVITSRKLYLK